MLSTCCIHLRSGLWSFGSVDRMPVRVVDEVAWTYEGNKVLG